MVSAWWLLAAFVLGGSAGMLVMAMMSVARDLPKKAAPTPVLTTTLP